jgi:hypothetical protein
MCKEREKDKKTKEREEKKRKEVVGWQPREEIQTPTKKSKKSGRYHSRIQFECT